VPGGRFKARENTTPPAYAVWFELITMVPTPGIVSVMVVGAHPALSV